MNETGEDEEKKKQRAKQENKRKEKRKEREEKTSERCFLFLADSCSLIVFCHSRNFASTDILIK